MPSSSFHVFSGYKPFTLHIERAGGNLDHFYHLVMDLAWPLHHWAQNRPGGWEGVRGLNTREERARHFAGQFQQMMGRTISPTGLFTKVLGRSGLVEKVELIGFNSRVRDYLRTFPDLALFRDSRAAFIAQVAKGAGDGPRHQGTPTVILIERAAAGDDRGSTRRTIQNHEELKRTIAGHCERAGAKFQDLRMESLGFKEQFQAVRQGPTVLIGQHGAGLLHGLWMEEPGSAIIELAGEDNPPHFENLFNDLGMDHSRIVCPARGDHMKGQSLSVDPEAVVARLKSGDH